MSRTEPSTTTRAQRGLRVDAAAMGPIVRGLGRLRTAARAMLVARASAWVVAGALAGGLGLGLADYSLRLPGVLRWVVWGIGLGLIVHAIVRRVVPAAAFRPSLTDLALRLERSETGREAGLVGELASGLELSGAAGQSALEAELGAAVARRARERFGRARPWHLVSAGQTLRALGVLAVAAGAVVTLAMLRPTLTAIGAQRVLTPWRDAAWPRRTELADATIERVHPHGQVIELRTALVRTNHELGDTRVAARYRVIRDGQAGPDQRVLMTSQRTRSTIDTPAGPVRGEVYERPIDPPDPAQTSELIVEYWFETDDAQTDPARIRLVPPPRIVAARVAVAVPAYAAQTLADDSAILTGTRELGAGRDERAIAGPILAGSTVELAVEFNKPLPIAQSEEALASAWSASLAASAVDRGVRYEANGDEAVARFVVARSARLAVSLRDEFGLVGEDEAIYSLDVVPDAPPTAAVVEPAQDEAVLASAVVGVVGEGRDDLSVREVWLERRLARPPGGSQSGAPEPRGDATVLVRESIHAQRTARVGTTLDLSTTGVRAGDELWITPHARDGAVLAGEPRAASVGTPRRLIIISSTELIERIRRELGGLREAARRLDELQGELQQTTRDQGPSEARSGSQDEIGAQITAQREIVDRLAGRVERNNLQDEAISGVLDDAGLALDAARQASDRAQQGLDEAAVRGRTDEGDAQIDREQARVRDELGRLAEMLDRGEDDWVVRRRLERLLDEQRLLREQTGAIGASTFGRSRQDLTPQELSELDRIAQRQAEAADRAGETLDELNERGRDLAEIDPAKSMGMQQAADRGRQSQIEQRMREAAGQIGQNQTGDASSGQQAIVDELEKMIEDLDDAQRNRDEALKRILASVIDSIRGLVAQQQRQLDALDAARGERTFAGLDRAMIRVNTNTLGVLDQVASSGQELAPVAGLLDQASGAQGEAIRLLRSVELDDAAVEEAERSSLARLGEALAEAQRLEQEAQARDQARVRAELREAYRAALERQVVLRRDTEPMAEIESPSRRQRQQIRGLGEQQDGLSETLADLLTQTEGMAGAAMFVYAHDRLERVTGRAAGSLRAGRADTAVLADQATAIRVLRSLVEALREPEQPDDAFREDDGGGGGSGDGQSGDEPLIPPMAELLLLRSMQAEALERTRAAAAGPIDAREAAELAGLQRELSELGQELIEQMQQQPKLPGEDQPGEGPPVEERPGRGGPP